MRPDFKKYTKASEAVRAVLQEYDEGMEADSLDEAHLDVTDHCRSHGMTGVPFHDLGSPQCATLSREDSKNAAQRPPFGGELQSVRLVWAMPICPATCISKLSVRPVMAEVAVCLQDRRLRLRCAPGWPLRPD